MSHLKYHKKVNKTAYFLLYEKLKQEYFPKRSRLWFFDTLFSPDTAHIFKFFYAYDKFNHMNSDERKGSYSLALDQYEKLVRKLKLRKGSFNASWLGHYVTDCLEPMHMVEWREEKGKERRKKAKFHVWVEHNTRKTKFQSWELVQIKEPIDKYLNKKTDEIKKLEIQNYSKKDKQKIRELYEEKIMPAQVEAVASIWYKAVCEANGIIQ